MNRLKLTYLFACLASIMLMSSCKEDIDTSSRYVFKEHTIASFLESHEQYSEYTRLLREQKVSNLSETSVYQLMTAYGCYTCFAPTNDAIQLYLDSLVIKGVIPEASWESFPDEKVKDSIRTVLVMNSILDGTESRKNFICAEFPDNNEEFSVNTMADRKISVVLDSKDLDNYLIDGICPISKVYRDIETINGIIHEVGYVINPSNETLGSTLHRFAFDYTSNLSVMARLIEACGLIDTLSKVRDEVYEELYQTNMIPTFFWENLKVNVAPPEHRKYGFTLFAETDEFWEKTFKKSAQDIQLSDVIEWVREQNFYPSAIDDDNFMSENNLLNQFVTYHLLPMRIPVDKLALHYNEKGYNYKQQIRNPVIPVWTHYTTMGKRRLLRLWESAESDGVYINRFPVLDNGRRGTYHEISCDEDKAGIKINTGVGSGLIKLRNSVIYPIDNVLAYDNQTRVNLQKNRLRYDVFEFMPEAMSNDMRIMGYFKRFFFTNDYQYFEDCTINSELSNFMMLNGWDQGWPNYQADEFLCEGLYDVTIRVPPVPMPGVYEIRMGVSTASPWRGICQIYFGSHKDALTPQGIPVDMALGGADKLLGWEEDTDDDDYNAEMDKKMRNNGFMKGPAYIVANAGGNKTNRDGKASTRRIIVREHMDPDITYYLRFKTVQDKTNKQLFIDYLEWCPKEVYDNPVSPEDIW